MSGSSTPVRGTHVLLDLGEHQGLLVLTCTGRGQQSRVTHQSAQGLAAVHQGLRRNVNTRRTVGARGDQYLRIGDGLVEHRLLVAGRLRLLDERLALQENDAEVGHGERGGRQHGPTQHLTGVTLTPVEKLNFQIFRCTGDLSLLLQHTQLDSMPEGAGSAWVRRRRSGERHAAGLHDARTVRRNEAWVVTSKCQALRSGLLNEIEVRGSENAETASLHQRDGGGEEELVSLRTIVSNMQRTSAHASKERCIEAGTERAGRGAFR